MTEQEWLACTDPKPMLEYLRGKVSDRKLRLLGCAYCRGLWPQLKRQASRQAVAVAELFADGEATDEQRIEAFEEAGYATEATRSRGERAYAIAVAAEEVVEDETCDWYCGWYGLKSYLPRKKQKAILTCIFGNPFKPVAAEGNWLTPTVKQLAEAIYGDRGYDRMPILADALEEAGCTDPDILTHCRAPGPHVLGCWVVDLILSKDR
jgi:hypothetical protein